MQQMKRTPFEKACEVPPVSQVRVGTFEGTYVSQDPDQLNEVTLIGPPPLLGHWVRGSCPGVWLEISSSSQGMLQASPATGESIGRICSSNRGHKSVTEGTGSFREVRRR